MALFLETADIEAAQFAQNTNFIEGIITNPQLLATTDRNSLDVLEDLTRIFDGHVFYYANGPSPEARLDEAWQAYEVRPDRVVIKLATTMENLSLVSKLSGVDVAMTAIFSPAQAYLAAEVGAHYVIPYVHQASQTGGDGAQLLRDITGLLTPPTELLAGDLRSVEEALRALKAGAKHISLPLSLIQEMINHPQTQRIIESYNEL